MRACSRPIGSAARCAAVHCLTCASSPDRRAAWRRRPHHREELSMKRLARVTDHFVSSMLLYCWGLRDGRAFIQPERSCWPVRRPTWRARCCRQADRWRPCKPSGLMLAALGEGCGCSPADRARTEEQRLPGRMCARSLRILRAGADRCLDGGDGGLRVVRPSRKAASSCDCASLRREAQDCQ